MYLKCAHPDCSADFDYGQGRLFRFQQTPEHEKQPTHWHAVKHYWLCARCCTTHTIEHQKGTGVLLMERLETIGAAKPTYYVLQADASYKPVLPRRLLRARVRKRKPMIEVTPGAGTAIEVLETRNLERRG